MDQRPDESETADELQHHHDEIRAKRAWRELMRDEFHPLTSLQHCGCSKGTLCHITAHDR